MSGRFDYVQFDPITTSILQGFKDVFLALERRIDEHPNGRAKSLAMTQLEEAYMWIGKMLRDEQIASGGSAADVPERTNE